MSDEKLLEALKNLTAALKAQRARDEDKLAFMAVSKAFEVTFEYVWKFFKRNADLAGLEVYNPRESIRAAAQLELIHDLELWESFLNARNLSVHDYIGMPDKEFLPLIIHFEAEMKKIIG